jgi:protein-S-isoprenylcysteine O-methyltransferase Ste14
VGARLSFRTVPDSRCRDSNYETGDGGTIVKRLYAILGSFLFLLVAPGTVAVLVPRLISHWRMQYPEAHLAILRVAGVILIAAGIPMLLDSFTRFALQGLGTPAPILPTEHLVVSGLYRYVRNPMYVGVLCVILGQGLLMADVRVLGYGVLVWLACHGFVLAYEEPKLRGRFGSEYQAFCASVPRWIPRLRSSAPSSR